MVEFLSGCANLSKQFAAAGFPALAYDIIYGSMDRETICFVSVLWSPPSNFWSRIALLLFGLARHVLAGQELESMMVGRLL